MKHSSSIHYLRIYSCLFSALAALAALSGCGGGHREAGDADAGELADDAGDASDASFLDDAGGEADAGVASDAGDHGDAGGAADGGGEDAGEGGFSRTCSAPGVLTDNSGELLLSWEASDPKGREEGSCGGNGTEYVFQWNVPEKSLYRLALTGEVDGVLYVRRVCAVSDEASEMGCADGLNADILEGEIEAGTYFVFADAFGAAAVGTQTLTWEMSPHPCLSVTCGEGAKCQLSKETGEAECACAEPGMLYGGLEMGCVSDPCLQNPCAEDASLECVADVSSLPGHRCVPRTWTVMVFMSADNDLFANSVSDLEEMRRASLAKGSASGPDGSVRVVVLRDGPRRNDSAVMTIREGRVEDVPGSETFLGADGVELNMSDGDVLRDFGAWAVGRYPAEHCALVLWDHGSGWRSPGIRQGGASESAGNKRGFSNDVTSNDAPSDEEIFIASGEYGAALLGIREALESGSPGKKLDLVAFDACQMGLYETALATSPHAEFLLASEERIPAPGFDYERFLSGLFADGKKTAREWASEFPQAYIETSGYHYTMALTDLSHLSGVTSALDKFGDALRQPLLGDDSAEREAFVRALTEVRRTSLRFHTDAHVDLGDFAQKLSESSAFAGTDAAEKARDLAGQLDEAVISARGRGSYARSHGLALYLPSPGESVDADYFQETAPWHGSGWAGFLLALDGLSSASDVANVSESASGASHQDN